MLDRLAYLARMSASQLSARRRQCPNCGDAHSQVVSRKALVTTLRRCGKCSILFRAPTDPPGYNRYFYNFLYRQGFTTELPGDEDLRALMDSGFADSEKDYSHYIADLTALDITPGSRILDFGCSWGYGSWQLKQAGYSVLSAEISRSRAHYGRDKLGIDLIENAFTLADDPAHVGSFDCFFTCHVIEHLPAPAAVFALARKLLKRGGVFVSYTPNGSSEHRSASRDWDRLWGLVHPNFIDDQFMLDAFPDSPSIIASRHSREPIERLGIPPNGNLRLNLSGYELLFAARIAVSGTDL